MARSRGFLIIMLLVAGCAAPKPILYPNAYLQQVGQEVADGDIGECREMATDAGATASQGKSGQVAGSTTVGGRDRICSRGSGWCGGWSSGTWRDGWSSQWCDSRVPTRSLPPLASEPCL